MIYPHPPILLGTLQLKHYVSLLPGNDSQATMKQVLTKAPSIEGILKRYQWIELEPERDLYDFRQIESDRAFLAAEGKTLLPMVEDKTFELINPCPAYAKVLQNGTGGYTAVRWDPNTRRGFSSLVHAMGVRFGGQLRGIATQETAPGLNASQLETTGYTPERYVDYYVDLSYRLASVNVPLYWHANFMPQRQASIGDVLKDASSNLLLGGPDNWPDNVSLNERMYPFYENFIRTKFIGNSPPAYDYTYQELMDNAVRLGVSELFWVYTPRFDPIYVK